MKTIYLLLCLLIFSSVSIAQNQLNPLESTPYIEVTGEGKLEVVPDEIYLQFTLKERYDGRNKIELDNLEKKMKQLMQKNKFKLEDLSLADASADFISIKRKKKDVLASKEFVMKVSTTSELTDLLTILDEVDVQNAFVSRVDHSRIEDLKKDVKMQAVKNAKEKASYLLSAIDEKPGKVLFIQERETYEPIFTPRTKMMSTVMMDESEDTAQQEVEISFQKIKLNYKVFARFAVN